ncbi:hypothetical protein A8U91_01286 [Halomonas elongata]|uniref:Uncharacterized protein n=1 Tax=Halomonas elongata TaxID=2746 RepID=A0A1B8P3X5_HALEL|nr:hypothetical protein A8U91_01286 [Halomonas elongata]
MGVVKEDRKIDAVEIIPAFMDLETSLKSSLKQAISQYTVCCMSILIRRNRSVHFSDLLKLGFCYLQALSVGVPKCGP